VSLGLTFHSQVLPAEPEKYAPDRVLVQFRDNSGEKARAALGIELLKAWPRFGGLQVVTVPRGSSVGEIVSALSQRDDVIFAHPDLIGHYNDLPPVEPNDTKFVSGAQWNLKNTTTTTADISAPEAWTLRTSANESVVAIIDSGVRVTHEDLALNLWRNPGESGGGKETNSTDDDANGYQDDVHGIIAYNNSGSVSDPVDHGTGVASVVGAVGNNCLGIAGVSWNAKLMTLSANDISTGQPTEALVIECIDYALSKGANVINLSIGFSSGYTAATYALEIACRAAGNAGVPIVCAAGNSPFQVTDRPASFNMENIVTVVATTKTDGLSSYSAFGQTECHLGAPGGETPAGQGIWVCGASSDSSYLERAGTSLSAPHVTAALAMLKAQFPYESYLQHINRLYSSVDKLSGLTDKCQTGGRLNLRSALTTASSAPANDIFSNAYRLTYSDTSFSSLRDVSANNITATKESGEPNHGSNQGGKSVWWKFEPGSTMGGSTTITTLGTSFRSIVAVYTGSAVNSLTLVANAVAADEYSAARCTFTATGGSTYWVAIDGYDGASGIIRCRLQRNASAANTPIKFDTSTVVRKRSLTKFQVTISGPPSTTITLEKSVSLSAVQTVWASAGTVSLNGSGLGTFTDTSASIGQAFYRAYWQTTFPLYKSVSVNCVGYQDLSIPNGQSMRANQLIASSLLVSNLLPNAALENTVASGTELYRWDEPTQNYVQSVYLNPNWSDSTFTFGLGDGLLVVSTTAQTWTFAGQVAEGVTGKQVPSALSIRSSQIPMSGRVSSALGLPMLSGDYIAKMTSTAGVFSSYRYYNGFWTPDEPVIDVGECFYIFRPNTWTKSFEIWPRAF